jgi:uncharacterized tellurite resistance protein B-like protein
MTSTENLYYAIGELAYAIASADGKVQKEERQRFHDLVSEHLKNKDYAFDISDIIFQIMDRDKLDAETTYNWAMNQIRLNSHYLSPQLKEKFIKVMEVVASAYPPVTIEEQNLIDKFKSDIAPIIGDPVYYEGA